MDGADDDFAFLLAAVRRLLGSIGEEISSRREEGGRGEILAEHVLHALQAIGARVDAEEGRYPMRQKEQSKRAAALSLRLYAQLAWATHSALQWLRREDVQPLDLGALYFADESALELLGPGIEVVPVESAEYMYSMSSWPFDWLLRDELQEEVPEGPRPIVLAFPAHERRTMLMHCLFGHELSHAAVRKEGMVTKALEPLRESGNFDAFLAHSLSSVADNDELRAHIDAGARALAEQWIEELLCDGLAFSLLGPSYLFAFAEFGLSTGWSEPDPGHPSMALRTKLLVEMASGSGWEAYLKERLPVIWNWLETIASGPSKISGVPASFAERVCRNCLERVIEVVREARGERDFSRESWAPHDEHFAELLANDILPVQRGDGEAGGHREILLACWLGALEQHGNGADAISNSVGERDYQRFVAKALEMSTTLRVWKGSGIA